ncbi:MULTISPECIES: TIGR03557 family F420-dependent LLM class oxidoreductase [unclassified Rhodococcus (in: high G+C Gram-positive bacteria)]|uniref:TIGR03557 family F420-dependent LLM class oxidoreductase n=1 Tax=unclassified Rhodococcus (in: high G+C Gram-positive bacteria) TaxID=192944 RepID=UPI00146DB34B|nr:MULTISPECIES: TIGR03557 family F420-dependent LLM class oxidoreductase [unclassified Rhodococcus (in: high G+C Gram-positive bacteria)]MBF0663043.1 TIGR03557 family F420-dependent LLM class oxidoreductase [Rhodococcus sp. (in: high G+C Gram-positive bacteria)]NMD96212.1 TIGR03557 family F420-dependent LLM class oxidoreductase [Rhodococcus sp. BL-253-APC-6A1W]NME80049.1 TIGR03557 family F420-dependent LLM class oxidoreductase [Rhodococcus sp. 105337]
MKFGYKLAAEAFGPAELVRQAVAAEAAGFDFVEISDHYHPWLDVQGHSPFAWSVLGAIAARTDTVGLATGVTCPTIRYHPAIIAQAAATVSLLSDGRFSLGVGSGERLNEHVVGLEYPSIRHRQVMFRESLEIIRLLWSGGYHSYDGEYLQLDEARVFDLPEVLPDIVVAAGGPDAARLAAEYGDGLFTTEPSSELVETYRSAGGTGPRYAEMSVAWAPNADDAADAALRTNRWGVTGWKVMSELPNPVNFAAATETVRREDMLENFVCGSEPEAYLDLARTHADAGYDHLVFMNAGPDPDGFLSFFRTELLESLRALPASG